MESRAARRMSAHHVGRARHERVRPLSGFLIAAIIALAVQSLVVQTHIYRWSRAVVGAGLAVDLGRQGSGPEQTPNPSEPREAADCALCQHGLSGFYLTPSVASLPFQSDTNSQTIVHGESGSSERALSHAWHGRAPPA